MVAILLSLLVATTGIPRTVNADLTALAEQRVAEIIPDMEHRYLAELDNGDWDGWGEVLAWRSGDTTPLPEIVSGWLASPSHAAILGDPDFDSIGCGVRWSGSRLYVACILADSAGTAPVVIPPAPVAPPPLMSDTAVAH